MAPGNHLDSVQRIGPEWNERPVMVFDGQYDSHISTGDDYDTVTLASIFTMEPTEREKAKSPAFLPSQYHDYDAREHAIQRERGEFVALCGDIDKGDYPLARIESLVRAFAGDAAWLIYSSSHARPGDRRWRVIMPLRRVAGFADWFDAQHSFFAFMESAGVAMDGALDRAAQPVYLPNVPAIHLKSGHRLRSQATGVPLHYERATTGTNAQGLDLTDGVVGAGVAQIRRQRALDDMERERLRKEAEQRCANRPQDGRGQVMEDFNRTNAIADLLTIYGYKQSPRHSEDWRSPYQTGDSYATRIMDSDKWVSLSGSDTANRVGVPFASGCFGDAYDLFVHYDHKGDHKAAYRQLYRERDGDKPVRQATELPSDDRWAPMPDEAWDGPAPDDIAAVIAEEAAELAAEAISTTLPFFWFDEAEPNLDANDFVEGLLTTGSMSVIYGQSNCGKTFFIVDMALHVAMGREWRGRAVDQGAIVYLSLEGAQGIRNRLAAFRKHHELDERLPFVAMPKPVNLLNSDADVHAVIALVKHVAEESGLPVAMVIVDTLSRAMAGGNENSPEDMTALIGNCDRIRHATGSHVCVVHHSGKDDAKGARGHSSLRAATDTEIEIKRDPELTLSTVRVAKQRDLEAADPFNFTLQSVALGTNRRGKDVTSCVVVEGDKEVVIGRTVERLSGKEEDALNCLYDCLKTTGFGTETGVTKGAVTAVTVHAWKTALVSRGVTDRNNPNTARVQFNRIKNALVTKGKIQFTDTLVWIAKHCET